MLEVLFEVQVFRQLEEFVALVAGPVDLGEFLHVVDKYFLDELDSFKFQLFEPCHVLFYLLCVALVGGGVLRREDKVLVKISVEVLVGFEHRGDICKLRVLLFVFRLVGESELIFREEPLVRKSYLFLQPLDLALVICLIFEKKLVDDCFLDEPDEHRDSVLLNLGDLFHVSEHL